VIREPALGKILNGIYWARSLSPKRFKHECEIKERGFTSNLPRGARLDRFLPRSEGILIRTRPAWGLLVLSEWSLAPLGWSAFQYHRLANSLLRVLVSATVHNHVYGWYKEHCYDDRNQ
jgi:hypothetical protein